MPKEINGFFNRIYENFFMRDLTYIFGGSILLASIYHAFGANMSLEKNLLCAIEYVTQNFFTFLILITVTYFIGIIVQEGCLNLINKIIKTKSKDPEPYDSIDVFKAHLNKEFGCDSLRELERVIFFKNVGSAIGASSGLSALIFFSYFYYIS